MYVCYPITDYVLDQLIHSGEMEEDCREKVRSALLQRHRHLNSRKEGQERKILEHIRYTFGKVLLPDIVCIEVATCI